MSLYKSLGLITASLLISSCSITQQEQKAEPVKTIEPKAVAEELKPVEVKVEKIVETIEEEAKVVENRADIELEDRREELSFEEVIRDDRVVVDEVSPEVSPIASEVSGQE
jgi:hypothetical protein